MRLTERSAILILCLATFLAYANTLSNNFVWDDEVLIRENSFIRNTSYLAAAFTTDLVHNSHDGTAYYRPTQTLSYMIDYHFGGLDPRGYHITNLLLHLICVLLLWIVMRQLIKADTSAFLVALIFAVQPLNTNAVTYLSGRADSLALAGMLGALALHNRYEVAQRRQLLFFVASLLCYVFALFSRESAMVLPALILARSYLLGKRRPLDAFMTALPFFILMLVFLTWRFAVVALVEKPLFSPWDIPALLRWQIFFRALATYFSLLLWPAHLQMDRQVAHSSDWLTVAGVGCCVLLLSAMWWTARRSRAAFFGLCWFAIALLPMTGTLNLVATVAEHWLYVPMIGFYLAIAVFIPWRRVTIWMWIIIIAAVSARTIQRNTDWADGAVFFSRTSQAAKGSERVRTNLGNALCIEGKLADSLHVLLEAEQLNPRSTTAKFNLAVVYIRLGNLEKAREKLDECVALDPTDPTAWTLAAKIHENRGNLKLAQRYYRRALVGHRDLGPRLTYGEFLVRHHQYKEALAIVDECYALEPGNAQVFNLLGTILERGGQFERAIETYRYAATLDQHSFVALQNLGRCQRQRSHLEAKAHELIRGDRPPTL